MTVSVYYYVGGFKADNSLDFKEEALLGKKVVSGSGEYLERAV